MKAIYILSGLFNFIFGCLFFYIFLLWMMGFLYIANGLNWIMDPTLDEGLLLPLLFITFVASVLYFPILIYANSQFSKKVGLNKARYIIFTMIIFSLGLFTFYQLDPFDHNMFVPEQTAHEDTFEKYSPNGTDVVYNKKALT